MKNWIRVIIYALLAPFLVIILFLSLGADKIVGRFTKKNKGTSHDELLK